MAAAAVAQRPASRDYTLITQQLNKKATFEDAVQECIRKLADNPSEVTDESFRRALKRALTVARSRFLDSDVPLWRAGLALVRAAKEACAATGDTAFAAELARHERDCEAVLGSDAEPSSAAAGGAVPPPTGLFEGQLTGPELAGPGVPPAIGLQGLAAALLGQATAAATGEGGEDAAGDTAAPAQVELSPEMAEALQRELDAIAVEIMDESAAAVPRPPPPASKAVLRRLPREKVTQERWKELGGEDARCPVCFDLKEGDEILTLPCKHWAHPECLDPWLAGTNTCPTCRHELPTEDDEYERKKAREAQEAEERRGAENAVRGGEFLYI